VTRTDITMASGERLTVNGSRDEVEKAISDAARSGQTRLAWLADADTGEPVAVNPAQVSTLRASGGAD
jgi:hypothetical protein